jgi:drug/metabolite transporter (DMT)-like permease
MTGPLESLAAQPRVARVDNVRAMLWMTMTAACIVSMSAILKHLTHELPLAVVFFFRMAFAVPLVLPWIARGGIGVLATRRLGFHFLRGTVGAFSMWCWVFAVKSLALATFTAISFTRPLWMPLVAWLVLSERVGARRAAMILLGFAGVIVVARPTLDFDAAMLVALLGGAVSAVTMVQVKQLTVTEPSARIVFYFSVFGTLYAFPFAVFDWMTPTLAQFAWLALSALAAAAGQYAIARATAIGEATAVAPMDFVQLPLSAIAGLAIFSEMLDIPTFVGAGIIFLATLAMAREESRRRARSLLE